MSYQNFFHRYRLNRKKVIVLGMNAAYSAVLCTVTLTNKILFWKYNDFQDSSGAKMILKNSGAAKKTS